MTFEKKVYTMEDNVKYISFGIKDLVKGLDNIDTSLQQIKHALEEHSSTKKNDEAVPF